MSVLTPLTSLPQVTTVTRLPEVMLTTTTANQLTALRGHKNQLTALRGHTNQLTALRGQTNQLTDSSLRGRFNQLTRQHEPEVFVSCPAAMLCVNRSRYKIYHYKMRNKERRNTRNRFSNEIYF